MNISVFLFLFLSISSSFNKVKCHNILVLVPWYARSHYLMFESLLEELIKRGNQVTCISNFTPKEIIMSSSNYTNILIDPVYELKSDMISLKGLYEGSSQSYFQSFLLLQQLGVEISRHGLQTKNVQNFLKTDKSKFDLIILEQFYHESWLMFGHIYEAPVITINTNGYSDVHDRLMGLYPPWSKVSHNLLPYNYKMTFSERFHNLLISWSDYITRNLCMLYQQNQIIKEFYPKNNGKVAPSAYDLEKNISMIFVNSHVAIYYPRPAMPNVIDIGGMHLKNETHDLPNHIQKFLDEAENGVIYFNLGTNMKSSEMPGKLVKIFLENFSKRPQRVIWKFENDSLENLPENVMISKWIPQKGVLAHPNVRLFISHGGLFSTQESVFNGVPMLIFPFFSDQFRNAALAVKSKYALSAHTKDLTAEKLDELLDDLLEDPEFLSNARKVSQLFKDNIVHPMETALYWIDYVIKHKGAHHLKYQGEQSSLIEYYSLDIYGLILMMLAIIIYSGKHLAPSKQKSKKKRE